jgi:Dna[CI] antecedent, DciA
VDKLGKVLKTVVARQPQSEVLAAAQLRLALGSVLGEDLAAGCRVEVAQRGTVRITTPSHALAHQLRSDSEQVIRRLNEASHLLRRLTRLEVVVDVTPRRSLPPPLAGEGQGGGGRHFL